PHLWRLPGAGLRHRGIRRLRRRQDHRLPAFDPAWRGGDGQRPVHGDGAAARDLHAGLATIIVGNGLFKPNISSMVGRLYAPGDSRRDRGFTLFYMGINSGALIAPILTSYLAEQVIGTPQHDNYDVVFAASGV